jgi:hypothetical protein
MLDDACVQVAEYIAAIEQKKLREGIRVVMAISAEGNKFIQVCLCVHLCACVHVDVWG